MKNKILKTLLFSSLFLGSLAHASNSTLPCPYLQVLGSGTINLIFDINDQFSGDVIVEYAGKKSVGFLVKTNEDISYNTKVCSYIQKNLRIDLAEIIELENAAAGNGDSQSTQQIYLEKLARDNGHRQEIQRVLESFAKENK